MTKKKKKFYGPTDLPSRVSRLGVCLFVCFFLSGSKNDPKNTLVKNGQFYKILEKKNLPKQKTWVGRTHPFDFQVAYILDFPIQLHSIFATEWKTKNWPLIKVHYEICANGSIRLKKTKQTKTKTKNPVLRARSTKFSIFGI